MKSSLFALITLLLVLMCGEFIRIKPDNIALAQQPSQLPLQLTNEYRGTLDSLPHSFIDFQGETYFGAAGSVGGFWKTDGTEEGTVMIKDVRLDYDGNWDRGYELVKSAQYIFFIAGQRETDIGYFNRVVAPFELWRSDGTAEGTIKLYEFTAKDFFRRPPMLVFQNMLYFTEETADHGIELWRSDGTVDGTAMFMDIWPGPESSTPEFLSNVDGLLYFSARTDDGRTIWWTDGTEQGTESTITVDDAAHADLRINNLVDANESLYFTTFARAAGGKFWRSDGTTEGTELLESSYPHPVGSAVKSAGGLFYWLNESFYQIVGLWFTGGTGDEAEQLLTDNVVFQGNVVPTDAYLYFEAMDGNGESQTWRSDGTVEGTVNLGEPTIRLDSIDGEDVYFQGNDAHGYELWRTNGTITGTTLISDIVPSSLDNPRFRAYPSPIHPTDNGALFGVNEGTFGKELWRSDGSAEGTRLVKDIDPTLRGLSLSRIAAADDFVYMIDGWNHILGHRFSMMKSDGTANGTDVFQSFDFVPNAFDNYPPVVLYTIGNTLYYLHSGKIWKSDGTFDGTVVLVDSGVDDMVTFDEKIYFSKDGALWLTDGTLEGAALLANFRLDYEATGIHSRSWYIGGDRLYFVADTPQNGDELWRTDGTPSGTKVVKRASMDGVTSFPRNLFYHNGLLYFSDRVGESFHRGLWITDGTEEGSGPVTSSDADLYVSEYAAISLPASTRSLGNGSLVLFSGFNQAYGSELWRTDGTAEGTALVVDIYPAGESSNPTNLTSMDSYILFVANDQDGHQGLWRSDGTAEGTEMIAELRIGTGWPLNAPLLRVGNFLYFSADDGEHGFELWRSDGTAAGTVMLSDFYPGSIGSNPQHLTYRDSMLYFSANNGLSGEQLFAIPVEAPTSLSTIDEPTVDLRSYLPLFSTSQ